MEVPRNVCQTSGYKCGYIKMKKFVLTGLLLSTTTELLVIWIKKNAD